jgi:hypothetical protein
MQRQNSNLVTRTGDLIDRPEVSSCEKVTVKREQKLREGGNSVGICTYITWHGTCALFQFRHCGATQLWRMCVRSGASYGGRMSRGATRLPANANFHPHDCCPQAIP